MKGYEILSYSELSPQAQQAVPEQAPMATKMMAAKAMMPLMSKDLIMVLYYLCFDPDPTVATTAQKSLLTLPDNIILPVLKDKLASPKILTFFGLNMMNRAAVAEAVALNANTPDNIYARMAYGCRQLRLVEIFAGNQMRLLRYPLLIDALSKNPATPKNIVERIQTFYLVQKGNPYSDDLPGAKPQKQAEAAEEVEEEVTEDENVEEEIEADEELLEEDELSEDVLEEDTLDEDALGEDAFLDEDEIPEDFSIEKLKEQDFDVDSIFGKDLLIDPEEELSAEKRSSLENRIRKMTVMEKMQLALKGNIEARTILIKSPNKLIQECVVNNNQITMDEVIRISRNKAMREEIIRMVCTNRDWIRSYMVKLSLIYNPKTPITYSMKWLDALTIKDLEKLAKSKSIPGMLAVSARKSLAYKQKFK